MDKILSTICDIEFGGHCEYEVSPLDMLLGYAKLFSMNRDMVDRIFSDQEDQNKLQEIRKIMDNSGVNFALLKQTATLVMPYERRECSDALYNTLDDVATNLSDIDAKTLLEMILQEDCSELTLYKEAKSFEDVQEYVNQQRERDEFVELFEDTPRVNKAKSSAEKPVEPDSPDFRRGKLRGLVEETNILQNSLLCKVKGQDEAVRAVAEGYFQSEFLKRTEERQGCAATFLFAGPPGVGKTFLSLCAAKSLDRPFKRFDMSEFCNEYSTQRLAGIPRDYKNPKAGLLTDFVDDNPNCIILLDEIEKAHLSVIYLFLQILDSGSIVDAFFERDVSFRDTILIFTTNLGKSVYEDNSRKHLSSTPVSVILEALRKENFPAAMVSRFATGSIVMFNRLSAYQLEEVADEKVREFKEDIRNEFAYEVDVDERVVPLLMFNRSNSIDARNITAHTRKVLKNEFREFGRHIKADSLKTLKKIHYKVEMPEDPELLGLFVDDSERALVYLGDERDLVDLPLSDRYKFDVVSDREQAVERLSELESPIMIIDPWFGEFKKDQKYLSFDDRKSEGILCFEEVTEKLPQIPVYFLEKKVIADKDRQVFKERGLRDFIICSDPVSVADEIISIYKRDFIQRKVDELSGRNRILEYDTKQTLYNKGVEADLTFYDFRLRVAADQEDNKLLLNENEIPKDRFEDIIGAEEAKSELRFFVDYLKNPKKYMAKSIKPPKGILLYGPPGTGKTMLARAMAGECGVSFFYSNATDFGDKYVGESEANIRKFFATARKYAPSIIFIDEIDAIGRKRTGSELTIATEKMLNTLMTEMDGFFVDPARPVFLVAATNFGVDKPGETSVREGLDPALLRRFDNRVYVDLPKESEREKYLQLQCKSNGLKGISQNAIHSIAQRTTGKSLAILERILNLAIRNAGKKDADVTDEELLNALEEYLYGTKKEWEESYYLSTARHEAGHAYICYLSGEMPSYVTIVSRGDFGGYMQHASNENTPTYSKEKLIWKIRTALAGRASELEFYGDEEGINTGASGDLESATNIAMSMICRYGMSDLGLVSMSVDDVMKSQMADILIKKANEVLAEELANTRRLVAEGKDKIEKLALYLVENNQATEDEIKRILEG